MGIVVKTADTVLLYRGGLTPGGGNWCKVSAKIMFLPPNALWSICKAMHIWATDGIQLPQSTMEISSRTHTQLAQSSSRCIFHGCQRFTCIAANWFLNNRVISEPSTSAAAEPGGSMIKKRYGLFSSLKKLTTALINWDFPVLAFHPNALATALM